MIIMIVIRNVGIINYMATNSIIETKLPKISGFSRIFMSIPMLFSKFYEDTSQCVANTAMAMPRNSEFIKMKNSLDVSTKSLSSDQSFSRLKAYTENAMVLIEITKDDQSRAELQNLIDTTITHMQTLTLARRQDHQKNITKLISDYFEEVFNDTKTFQNLYKEHINSILKVLDGFLLKTHAFTSSKSDGQSTDLCACSKPITYCTVGGEYEEIKDGNLTNQDLVSNLAAQNARK